MLPGTWKLHMATWHETIYITRHWSPTWSTWYLDWKQLSPTIQSVVLLLYNQDARFHRKRSYLPHSHAGTVAFKWIGPTWVQAPLFGQRDNLGITVQMVLFQHSLTPRLIAWWPKPATMKIVIPFIKGGRVLCTQVSERSEWLTT